MSRTMLLDLKLFNRSKHPYLITPTSETCRLRKPKKLQHIIIVGVRISPKNCSLRQLNNGRAVGRATAMVAFALADFWQQAPVLRKGFCFEILWYTCHKNNCFSKFWFCHEINFNSFYFWKESVYAVSSYKKPCKK